MNTQQAAVHIVNQMGGKGFFRRQQRLAAEAKQQQCFDTPKWWVHAHINARANWKSGYLAQIFQERHTDLALWRDSQEYVERPRRLRAAGK